MVAWVPAGATAASADADLVALLPRRDRAAEAALALLYERHASRVYGLSLRLLGDTRDAEDLVQETFWRLWCHASRYQPRRGRLTTWLLRVARNLALDQLRRAARRPHIQWGLTPSWPGGGEAGLADEPHAPDSDVADQLWAAEQRRVVLAGLCRLPAAQRQAVELAYFGGCTHAQIAAAQGVPLGTAKGRVLLGLRKLAAHLSAHGITPAVATP